VSRDKFIDDYLSQSDSGTKELVAFQEVMKYISELPDDKISKNGRMIIAGIAGFPIPNVETRNCVSYHEGIIAGMCCSALHVLMVSSKCCREEWRKIRDSHSSDTITLDEIIKRMLHSCL
jgi:hypothetical protein